MICLDSTFLIDVLRDDTKAIEKLREMVADDKVVTTIINASEMLFGFYGAKIQQKEIEIAKSFLARILVLGLDIPAILKSGEIRRGLMKEGRLIGTNDLLTAGIMLHNGCSTILTRDVKDFERISGISVITY